MAATPDVRSGIALVTGATGAVCSEVAAGLAREGMDVILTCRPSKLDSCRDEAAALWRARGVPLSRRCHVEPADLSRPSSVSEPVSYTHLTLPTILLV